MVPLVSSEWSFTDLVSDDGDSVHLVSFVWSDIVKELFVNLLKPSSLYIVNKKIIFSYERTGIAAWLCFTGPAVLRYVVDILIDSSETGAWW